MNNGVVMLTIILWVIFFSFFYTMMRYMNIRLNCRYGDATMGRYTLFGALGTFILAFFYTLYAIDKVS